MRRSLKNWSRRAGPTVRIHLPPAASRANCETLQERVSRLIRSRHRPCCHPLVEVESLGRWAPPEPSLVTIPSFDI
jgi:hypothetical protein